MCTLPQLDNDKACKYDNKKPGKASWEPIWTLDYSEQGEKMQRVVATRMFKPDGVQGYEWKMGSK